MNEKAVLVFLKLCGASVDQATVVSGTELALRHSSALNWIIAPGLVLGVLTCWSYGRGGIGIMSPMRRCVLAGLRLALFALLLILPLQPILSLSVFDGKNPQRLLTIVEAALWSSPLFFIAVIFIASIEWVLRKRWQFK